MTEGWSAEGWYAGRKEGVSEWKGGPYTWAQLSAYVAEGRIAGEDLVWHESLPDWVAAASVPGLFPASPTAQPIGGPLPIPAQPSAPRKSHGGLVALAVIVVVALLVVAGGGAFWAWSSGMLGAKSGGAPKLGVAEVTRPDRAKLVKTAAYGEVPANQIGVVLKDGARRSDADAVAKSLGGSVVGEVEYINAFQIQFPGSTEADLKRALEAAKSNSNVDLAFANQEIQPDAEIKGVRVDPYDDPIYDGGAGDGYKAIGVSKAWAYIKGSGVKLSEAHVGIVDDGLYRAGADKMSEFGGDTNVDFPDPAAGPLAHPEVNDDHSVNEAGSHGTGVATIIGADPDNGGATGVAGPLGNKLKMSMINQYGGKYGDSVAAPDPDDPAKEVWSDGKTYALGSLVALTKQIEGGATVINCSWGNVNANPIDVAAYKKFFTKMAADHPGVMFVCSGGNTGTALDGSKRFPSGLALPNMITVGAVDNDGRLASYSSKSSANYEVTLAAPGTQAVVGMKSGGGAEQQDGTSFAAPHVTAAVAILQSIDPKLSAGQIKDILVSTARKGITVGEPGSADYHSNLAPPETGGRVLALDLAVLKVINDVRAEKGLPALTDAVLEKMGVIDAIATTGKPGEYSVKGILEATGEQGTEVTIDVTGEDHAIGGSTKQKLSGPGEATWDVTLPKGKGTILVKRLDNGAASLITIESFNINGKWSGSFTVTEVNVTDAEAAKGEGCGPELYAALKGKALPMTMDITADESGNGSAETLIDVSSLNSNSDSGSTSEPQKFGLTYSGSTVTFDMSGSKGVSSMTGNVSQDGDTLTMKGVLTGGGKGWSIKAVFTLTKPAQ